MRSNELDELRPDMNQDMNETSCQRPNSAAEDFLLLWESGACDDFARDQLNAILQRCPLSGRIMHGSGDDPNFGKLLATDEWKRITWVFGPEALHSFLGKSTREICLQLGMSRVR